MLFYICSVDHCFFVVNHLPALDGLHFALIEFLHRFCFSSSLLVCQHGLLLSLCRKQRALFMFIAFIQDWHSVFAIFAAHCTVLSHITWFLIYLKKRILLLTDKTFGGISKSLLEGWLLAKLCYHFLTLYWFLFCYLLLLVLLDFFRVFVQV